MSDDGKNRGIATDHLNQPYYGTFQGVANYYPPPPQPPPQPTPPPGSFACPRYYYQGYQTAPVYAVADNRPIREHRLPCCGLGLGWLLFIIGFFLGGIPWYIGTFILLCVHMDYREKPGLIACTVASITAVIALTLGVRHRDLDWKS